MSLSVLLLLLLSVLCSFTITITSANENNSNNNQETTQPTNPTTQFTHPSIPSDFRLKGRLTLRSFHNNYDDYSNYTESLRSALTTEPQLILYHHSAQLHKQRFDYFILVNNIHKRYLTRIEDWNEEVSAIVLHKQRKLQRKSKTN